MQYGMNSAAGIFSFLAGASSSNAVSEEHGDTSQPTSCPPANQVDNRCFSAVVPCDQPFVEGISRDVISYLKLSGSRLSLRPSVDSACGYMRKPTGAPTEPGSVTS